MPVGNCKKNVSCPFTPEQLGWLVLDELDGYTVDRERITRFIEWGADVGQKNLAGQTVLMNAMPRVKILGTRVIRMIVERCDDIDAEDSAGNTALHLAILQNEPEIVKILVEQGASIDAPNNRGETPMMTAIERHKRKECFDSLLWCLEKEALRLDGIKKVAPIDDIADISLQSELRVPKRIQIKNIKS